MTDRHGELFVEPGEIISQDLLSIRPTKYRFPVELKKRISFVLQLTNKTDEYVAFKILYCLEQHATLQEAPHDMPFEDMILLQSFIAPKGVTGKDTTPEMFDDETGKVVEEFELRVIYVPADPLIPEGSGEGSARASGVDNGNQKLYSPDPLHFLPPKSSGEGSSARAFGVKNGNQNFYLLDP
ncbi:hypothetical protein MKX03_014242, partial [Papaver bracteatum]